VDALEIKVKCIAFFDGGVKSV